MLNESLTQDLDEAAIRGRHAAVTGAAPVQTPDTVTSKQAKPMDVSSNDFVTELAADKTYAGIDVLREWGKALNWCRVNNRKATKRFFVNWLNKIDKPLPQQKLAAREERKPLPPLPQPMSEEQRLRNLEEIRKLKATMQQLGKQWDMNEAIK